MADRLAEALGRALGARVERLSGHGGSAINATARADLADDRAVFIKHRADAAPGAYEAEADGLAWLAETQALRIPRVLGVGADPPRFLALEWIAPGRPAPDHDERLGRGLAALHGHGAEGFGHDADNLIGPLPQPNAREPDWPTFYAEHRILPFARAAREEGRLPSILARRLESLARRLPDLCGPAEPPARLHGDLWSGNAIVDADGAPVLVDPAVYGGHREIDLAMMRLFGGFATRVFDAYREAHPPAPGEEERRALWQVYPLLVHVRLFGGGYLGRLERAVAAYE